MPGTQFAASLASKQLGECTQMSASDRSQPDPYLAELLDALPRSTPPPDALESRAIRSARPRRPVARMVVVSAALVIFACGLGAGRLLSLRTPPSAHTTGYMLLLYENNEYRSAQPGDASARVEEYRAWARRIAESGVTIDGERLEVDGLELEGGDGSIERRVAARGDRLAGYFVVSTATRAEAERIATTCPHLRHGGRVVVKAILPT
jgi:hypothetical protein